jgi:hypothetical protein
MEKNMIAYPKERDKRQHRRLPAISLTADVKVKRGLFSRWEVAPALDFNIYGVALILNDEPTLGTKLLLKLSLKMDMTEVNTSQIEAKVVNKVMIDSKKGQWRVGFIFANQSKHTEDTTKQLKRINEYLERNNNLKEKLNDER